MRAVRFSEYGDVDVLHVENVELREIKPQEVVVAVRSAGINPGEASIRSGLLHDRFPATFPSGQGSDLAGTVTELGEGVSEWSVGDEVLGWSWERSSQAELVVVPADQLVTKPAALSFDVAGALYVAGCTAYAAVEAVAPQPGETVVVSAAAGGVGSIAIQLVAHHGAQVIAIASERHREWLESKGAVVVNYGDQLKERVAAAAPDGVSAFIDLYGAEYVRLALELEVDPARINTIIAFDAAQQFGTKSEGSAEGTSTKVLAELADLAARGAIEVPIAATYPLEQVQQAFLELEQRHTLGKIVLHP
jgi:NADPH:quinone reductase-like Zn-dependent oxidoreductase